mmetsp:Transcript_26145/g.39724  ORF Transcript_26145/g.39724 Transcript_26145/m.39724 type:complete len:151 (+) Transcript_26145:3-455(+)
MHRLLDYDDALRTPTNTASSYSKEEWCQPHFDYGSFTLIWADSTGLQVQAPGSYRIESEEAWLPAPPDADLMVIVGKALSFVSSGELSAPLHRVVLPSDGRHCAGRRRSSIALFVEPSKDTLLQCSDSRSEPIKYSDFKKSLRSQAYGSE